ncbi:metal-dependent transcriptional regulator [Weissella confusa]|uniref:metal-dependent transcriptional regulator n=1 Tax=Weissella confusa TaxID=1583 RepID=UPI0018F1EBFD|nr:metal-dependent transcriptional regulator [Weissella confusa]MBJ7650610.1 metal-dependent transcriptional regulator [Weissella confusa]MBJ7656741.1 metal-dependent transcriptional regulator [Weissella confusa]MBJ7664695.1 metal-dependent transcriptional regulator [Weissella confusa]
MSESVSKTQYLQTILELSGGDDDSKISNNQIADHLNVTPSSVSNMLAKLQEAGEVDVVPYYGVTLTEPGRQTALRLIRSHRLIETFGATKLGLSISEAHFNADNLDHDADDEFVNALEKFLDYPKYSPHGLLIPDANYNYEPDKLRTLRAANDGETVTLNSFTEDLELLQYVETVGVTLGSTWTIKERLPFDGPLVLADGQNEVQITQHAADFIYINN